MLHLDKDTQQNIKTWLKGKYDAINIKLDKTGGLTEALALALEAKSQNYTKTTP